MSTVNVPRQADLDALARKAFVDCVRTGNLDAGLDPEYLPRKITEAQFFIGFVDGYMGITRTPKELKEMKIPQSQREDYWIYHNLGQLLRV